MLLEQCRVRLQTPPCNPSLETINAVVEFDDDLTDLLPYLNAELGPGQYDPDVPFLRLKVGGRGITVHPKLILVTKLRDQEEAAEVISWLKDTLRSVDRRRGEIGPSYKTIGKVSALDVLKLLPRTNCGRCGYSTCLAFAVAVAGGECGAEDCPPLSEPGFEERKGRLCGLLGADL